MFSELVVVQSRGGVCVIIWCILTKAGIKATLNILHQAASSIPKGIWKVNSQVRNPGAD